MTFKDRYLQETKKFGGPYALEALGVKKGIITGILNGSIPKANNALKIADALKVDLRWLISGGEQKEEENPTAEEVVSFFVLRNVSAENMFIWLRQGAEFIKSQEIREIARKQINQLEVTLKSKRETQKSPKRKPSTAS